MARKKKRKQSATPPTPKPVDPDAPRGVVIGWIDNGTVSGEFARNVANVTARGVQGGYLRGQLRKRSGPRIAYARNHLVADFLATSGGEWLLWLDADMVFEPDFLERLLEHAHPETAPMVGALCFGMGRDGYFPTLFQAQNPGPGKEYVARQDFFERDTLTPVDATGSAGILIHRSVFERVKEVSKPPWIWYQETELNGATVGEDVTFCLRVRGLGIPIYVHTGIQMGHEKTTTIDLQMWEEWRTSNRFTVTGTGRCGTGYISTILRNLSINCGHENVYNPHVDPPVWGDWRGESSWLAAPHLSGFGGQAGNYMGRVIHLVRNPLDVLNSLMGIKFFDEETRASHGIYREYAEKHCPSIIGLEPLEAAQRFIVDWNGMVAPHAAETWRVEDVSSEQLTEFIHRVGGRHSQFEVEQVLVQIPTNLNSRPRAGYTWDDTTPEFRAHAVALGYDVTDG